MRQKGSNDTTTFFAKKSLSWNAQVALAKANWTPTEKEDYDAAFNKSGRNQSAPIVTLALCKILERVFTERGDELYASKAAAFIKSYSMFIIPEMPQKEETSHNDALKF